MGYYINPNGMSKEQFLAENGKPITEREALDFWKHPSSDKVPVCWVDNGQFTAAGIAHCLEEAQAFAHPCGRPKQWYMVSRESVRQWLPEKMK